MEENKNFETIEETETAVEAEAALEEAEEIVEETIEEAVVEDDEEEEAEPKAGSKAKAIVAAILALVIVVAAAYTSTLEFNKYNRLGYVNKSGRTIQQLADMAGVSLEEFLTTYQLPADMPGNTTEAAAFYTMPAGLVAKNQFGVDLATLKMILGIPENMTEDMTWGEVEGSILVINYIGGAERLEEFKQTYGFGDEITAETTWGEIRNKVETIEMEQRKAAEEAAAQAPAEEPAAEAPAETPAEEKPAETPAE